jgi:ArsR family transcriptional regulator, nickel/cobalt-responsive transcriptional repressor
MSHGVRGRTSATRLDRELAGTVAETMQALATPSRLLILDHLRRGPSPVGDLARAVGMEPSAVSHQLRLLRHLGLVAGERRGRRVVYALHDEHVGDLLQEAIGHAEHVRLGRRGSQGVVAS